MRKRHGFSKFIRKVEGLTDTHVAYFPLPKRIIDEEGFKKGLVIQRYDNHFLVRTFIWDRTEQGQSWWSEKVDTILDGGVVPPEMEEIFSSWREQVCHGDWGLASS